MGLGEVHDFLERFRCFFVVALCRAQDTVS